MCVCVCVVHVCTCMYTTCTLYVGMFGVVISNHLVMSSLPIVGCGVLVIMVLCACAIGSAIYCDWKKLGLKKGNLKKE